MSITMLDDDNWIVQVQRKGIRKTKRGKGGVGAARAIEKRLIRQVDLEQQEKKTVQAKTVKQEESQHVPHNLAGNSATADPQRQDGPRQYQPADLAQPMLEKDQDPHVLHRATG